MSDFFTGALSSDTRNSMSAAIDLHSATEFGASLLREDEAAPANHDRWGSTALLVLAMLCSLASSVIVPITLGDPHWGTEGAFGAVGLVHECSRAFQLFPRPPLTNDCLAATKQPGAPLTVCRSVWNEEWDWRYDPSDTAKPTGEQCHWYDLTDAPTAQPTSGPVAPGAPTAAPTTPKAPLPTPFTSKTLTQRKTALGFMLFFGIISTILHFVLAAFVAAVLAAFCRTRLAIKRVGKIVPPIAVGIAVLTLAVQAVTWMIWKISPYAAGYAMNDGFSFFASVLVSFGDIFTLVVVIARCCAAAKEAADVDRVVVM